MLLIAAPGFTDVLITAQDNAVDSDVVLESATKEIKSAPQDTINVIGDSIKYVKDETQAIAKGLAAPFKKDPHAAAQKDGLVEIAKAWDSSGEIISRSYTVSAEVGKLLMTRASGDGPVVDVSGFFDDIDFPRKTAADFSPELNNLFVRHTLENILSIEDVLADFQNARRNLMNHQVEIEAKFVEVSQKTLNELGFKWDFKGKGTHTSDGTVANGSGDAILQNLFFPAQDILNGGLRTAAGALGAGAVSDTLTITKSAGSFRWDLVINALEQAEDADVLSAPRIVTRDGSTATIQVGEEQMIPQAFEINSQDIAPWVEHTDWDLALMGVQMEVTPELREGGLIDLEIIPKIKELVGFDSYTAVPNYSATQGGVANVSVTGTLPYFRIREMETRVTIADGSTVGMGGLIYDKLETYRDKVPVLGSIPMLGRLFRSEGEQSVKRNLMIFVTATQVDVHGRRASDLALKK
jgi:general secretion pathway protein D